MPKSVGLVQLHFLPGSRFTDLETPVNQCLVNIYEFFTSPEAEYGYIFAGPHLDDPEKAVVLICYDRSSGESAVQLGLEQESPIYMPITPYLRSAPRVDVVDFARPLPTSYGHNRERVQELAVLRIPEYEESGLDDEDSDESDDENPNRRIRQTHRHCLLRDVSSSSSSSSSSFSSWVDVHDEMAANNNDDDDDANEIPADNRNNDDDTDTDTDTDTENNDYRDPNCHCGRRFFAHSTPCSTCAGEDDESELYSSSSSSSPSPSPSPFATPLAQLTSFFETAQSDNLHGGPADLASHRMGSRSRSTARPSHAEEEGGGGVKVVLHAYSWADADAMARFKDAGRRDCGDGCEREALVLRGEEDREGEGEGEGGDLWQTGFVRAVEALRERGAEVEVVTVELRCFSAVLGELEGAGGGGD
ncbi:hypothetical protein SLS58_010768 [Diplodia intermedia]|uniref:Uncharacterized protein n=1 Tax=Diplodia intermedia TaxID=856260 RepID=A0ABR3T3S4_9PEZI